MFLFNSEGQCWYDWCPCAARAISIIHFTLCRAGCCLHFPHCSPSPSLSLLGHCSLLLSFLIPVWSPPLNILNKENLLFFQSVCFHKLNSFLLSRSEDIFLDQNNMAISKTRKPNLGRHLLTIFHFFQEPLAVLCKYYCHSL